MVYSPYAILNLLFENTEKPLTLAKTVEPPKKQKDSYSLAFGRHVYRSDSIA